MAVQFIKLGTASFIVKCIISKLQTVVYSTYSVMFRKNGKADGFVELYFIAKKAYASLGFAFFFAPM